MKRTPEQSAGPESVSPGVHPGERLPTPVAAQTCGLPVSVEEYEAAAREILPPVVFDYFAGGAGEEWTLRENRAAFHRWVLRPRVLVDVAERDAATTVLGTPVRFPILVAPTAMQRLASPDGELSVARACAAAGTIMALSTTASASIEEVAEAVHDAPLWFQLYVHRDRELTADLVRRSAAAFTARHRAAIDAHPSPAGPCGWTQGLTLRRCSARVAAPRPAFTFHEYLRP